MTHKKHEIAVFIENEEMLKEVGNTLTEHGETLEEDFYLLKQRVFTKNTHVYFHPVYDEWCVYNCYKTVDQIDETPVTLPQLEEILKISRDMEGREYYTYKIKCRNCLKISEMVFSLKSKFTPEQFRGAMNEKSTYPQQSQCSCDNGSIMYHDIVSYCITL